MSRVLTLACVRTDRAEAFFSGNIRIPDVELAPLALPPSELFPRALKRAEFDITELSASSYLVQTARGDCAYTALPVFLSRSFRFDSIYVRTDRGIDTPQELKGRRVGTPEFQMTASLWMRGILQERFGVDHREIQYFTGGLNTPGRKERISVEPAAGVSITPLPESATLDALLSRGDIDAVMAPEPPLCFREKSAPVKRLFGDTRAAERSYFSETGIFPIMHVLAVRRTLLESRPELARLLYDAFVAARDAGYRRLRAMADATSLPLMLPWLSADLADIQDSMGEDYWPYGLAANKSTLEALCRYSFDQNLSARLLEPAELFPDALSYT